MVSICFTYTKHRRFKGAPMQFSGCAWKHAPTLMHSERRRIESAQPAHRQKRRKLVTLKSTATTIGRTGKASYHSA